MVGEKYLRALIDGSGGIPIIVPALSDAFGNDDILNRCDGVLFTGSPSNVEPHHYDGGPSEDGTMHDAAI